MSGDTLGSYRTLDGVPDEFMDDMGQIRPVWQRFASYLDGLSPSERAAHLARADQYLLDSGVFYRQYGRDQSAERPWPLSHIPLLIDEAEWRELTAGLFQRADLLEALMADLYGPNRLVADGKLPPELVAGNREWLRPMVGLHPRSGYFLHFLAFELGRGPDGKWWVLADRTQAPSGAGYALENRVATSRAFSELYARQNVYRLAGFFRSFRDTLTSLRSEKDGRVAILTPGPLNETYFEHAYIARYLGFNLVQGEDLAVDRGSLMVRTVSGLRPVDVLWRRLDGSYADPLELDHSSRLGTPGMVSALRAGGFTMVNALGSGVLETRAFMAFLPKLAESLTGRPLDLPNIATWWCGDPVAREAVQCTADRMILSPAMAWGLPIEADGAQVRAGELTPGDLAERLEREGRALVAQEAVTLSTTPALVDGTLQPRPFALRVFLARTASGWSILPGGFARIGASPDPAAINMQNGGSAADVWIVSRNPVREDSMLPSATPSDRRVTFGALPSRSADNLFWLGRYIERTEGVIRLLRSYHARLAETGDPDNPQLNAMLPLLTAHGVDPAQGIPEGLLSSIEAAIATAGQVRDRFSPDAWSALDDIQRTATRMATRVTPGDDAARACSKLLRKMAGITGLVHENMYRAMGWRFLSIGRLHERAMGMAQMLAVLSDPQAPEGALDLAIELGDSQLTHRRRFTVSTSRATVIDLLALDPLNPRSLRHQIDALREVIDSLPDANDHGALSPVAKAALRLYTALAVAEPEDMTPEVLLRLREEIGALSTLLTGAYL